jgi:hypothetical protein
MNNENQNMTTGAEKKKLTLRSFFGLSEVAGYFFRKKDPNRPSNIDLKMMHGVNKISILVFLAGVAYLLIKKFVL